MSLELADYLRMAEDETRTRAYLAAMRAVIRPGDRVLEIGTGFGFFAIHACQLGASEVLAVEPNDVIEHARALAEANGCGDRVRFVQARAETLPDGWGGDVLVEDLRGVSPLFGRRLAVLRDAQARLLAPGARIVPCSDTLVMAPAEVPADVPALLAPSSDEPATVHGIIVEPLRRHLVHGIHRTRAGESALLAAGCAWVRLDYAELGVEDPSGDATWTIGREGVLGGLLSWFEAELAPGIGFSTAPGSDTVYDRAFLPIGAPIAVAARDEVSARIRTAFDGEEYVWRWEVEVRCMDGRVVRRVGNDLGSRLMASSRRARRRGDFIPQRTTAIARHAVLAAAVDGVADLDEISRRVHRSDPKAFPTPHEALRWVAEALERIAAAVPD